MAAEHKGEQPKAGGTARTVNLVCGVIAALFVINFFVGLVKIPLWLVLIILVCDIVIDRVVVRLLRSKG
jgi:Flp pilus assembly protein TadB